MTRSERLARKYMTESVIDRVKKYTLVEKMALLKSMGIIVDRCNINIPIKGYAMKEMCRTLPLRKYLREVQPLKRYSH